MLMLWAAVITAAKAVAAVIAMAEAMGAVIAMAEDVAAVIAMAEAGAAFVTCAEAGGYAQYEVAADHQCHKAMRAEDRHAFRSDQICI